MKMSRREVVLGLCTLGVALFAGTAILAKARIEDWQELRAQQAQMRRRIALDERLLAQRETWETKLAEVSEMLPVQPVGKKVDVYWLSVMDRIAVKHGLSIPSRQAGDEEQQGEVYELPIEGEWEGSLEALVHFLFELQSEGAMLDVRQLLVAPKPKAAGQLRGRFTLYAAYTREKMDS